MIHLTAATRECDLCQEVWDHSFFCRECSGEPELIESRAPKVIYGGEDDDTEIVERYVYRAVCGNCCQGGHA